jgi:hypothetical protein
MNERSLDAALGRRGIVVTNGMSRVSAHDVIKRLPTTTRVRDDHAHPALSR